MKRPALCIGIPYVLGLVLSALAAAPLRPALLGCLLIPGMIVLIGRGGLWKYVLLSTLSCLTACCVYWHADNTAAKQLPYAEQEAVFTGTVTDSAVCSGGYAKYALKGRFSDGTPARVEYFCNAAIFSYGDTLTLAGTPKRFRSTYLFDAESYAKAQGMFLQFGLDTRVTDYTPLETPTLRSVIRNWRETMTRRIRARMGEETGAMLTGMLFGDKSGMSRESRMALYRMGIGHILVVSGLHFDLLAYLAGFALKKLKIGRKTEFALMCVLCVLFVLCAGETISVKRACIMILIRQSGRIFYRKADTLNSLSIAMLLLGLENPFVIHSASFWLSFTATFGIAVLAPHMTEMLPQETLLQTAIADFCSCCWCFLAVLPVSVLYFREISFLSPVSNTLLVPVCLGAMLFGFLALPFGCKGSAADFLLDGADVMNGWILDISHAAASLPWTHASTGSSVLLWAVFAGLVFSVLVYVVFKNRQTASFAVLCVLLITALSVSAEQLCPQGNLRIAMLGEEKNTVLVLTDGYDAMLFDLTGQKKLAAYADAYLTETGINHVTALCLCKPSAKSIRSYASYLGYFPPDTVWLLQDKPCPALFGVEPQPAEEAEFLFHGAKVQVQKHGIRIDFAGNTCVFTDSADEWQASPEVLYLYGKLPEQLPECGYLFAPAGSPVSQDVHTYSATDCAELTLTPSGTCRIRRLYG